ncbi:MAG TPA: dihydrolipoamide acetyltransferase family protein [Pseudolysinimonas sp.]|jgi:pyruvate dehydrogenase E2 component (dihydrolipoamide acetyltransferase)|nr:dihydrolipoamide acetyltransferase family protein [Pseudolysinimonas sp.]
MATVVRMPAALAGVTEGAIQSWMLQPGDTVAAGQALAEIETEKAVVEFESEVGGTVARLLVEPGDNVPVGAPIAVILAAGETDDAVDAALAEAGVETAPEPAVAAAPAPPEPETAPEAAAAPAASAAAQTSPVAGVVVAPAPEEPRDHGGRVFASPIVRRIARERGIDLSAVTGSGPGGRIVRRDLEGVPAGSTAAAAPAPAVATRAEVPTAASGAEVKLTPMRRAIARRLTESKTTVPHFYVTAHCRVDRLLELRREVNEAAERKVSVNDFVLKAVAGALLDVPAANAIWGGDHILTFGQADIAVAVAIEGGLLTPVIRGVDRMTLVEVAAAVADAAERARAGKLRQDELEGGSFSVSNLGMYGVDEFSAILNPPQSGILAVSAAKQQPVVDDGQLAVGTVMSVTLSADHRVIDGAVAAEWMAAFVRRIENPVSALL